mmetsp:Transcript_43610/g.94948  ORF Transcript_43610/g.94948 Transcript_43610/m.94948 type:complete len:216 (+) Transcript_43610:345-992(+)
MRSLHPGLAMRQANVLLLSADICLLPSRSSSSGLRRSAETAMQFLSWQGLKALRPPETQPGSCCTLLLAHFQSISKGAYPGSQAYHVLSLLPERQSSWACASRKLRRGLRNCRAGRWCCRPTVVPWRPDLSSHIFPKARPARICPPFACQLYFGNFCKEMFQTSCQEPFKRSFSPPSWRLPRIRVWLLVSEGGRHLAKGLVRRLGHWIVNLAIEL